MNELDLERQRLAAQTAQQRQSLEAQAQQERRAIEAQSEQQRRQLEQAAREAHDSLRRQMSDYEEQTQAAINQVRAAEAIEQRARSLPNYQPKDLQAGQRIASLNQQRDEAQGEIEKSHANVDVAKTKDLETIQKAHNDAVTQLEQAKQKATAELESAVAQQTQAIEAQAQALRTFEANNVKLNTGEYIAKADYKELSAEDQKLLAQVGVSQFNAIQSKRVVDFEANSVKLDTGEYVSKAEYNKLSASDQKLLKSIGVDAFNKRALGVTEAKTKSVGAVVPEGTTPGVTVKASGKVVDLTPEEKAEIAKQYPGQQVMVTLASVNVYPKEVTTETPGEKYLAELKGAERLAQAKDKLIVMTTLVSEVQKKLEEDAKKSPQVLQTPTLSMPAFRKAFLEAKGLPDNYLYGQLANLEYERLYGKGAAWASGGTQVASLLFSPARVLYPEVQLKDISAMEWAVGGAQLALLALPVVGAVGGVAARAASIGIQATAGAVFTAELGLEWKNMSAAERALSLIMTAVVVSPLAIGGLKMLGKVGISEEDVVAISKTRTKLSKAWASLDKAEVKYGRESPKYYEALKKVESAQAKVVDAIGNTSENAGKITKTTIGVAKEAGNAADDMKTAVSKLNTQVSKSKNLAQLYKSEGYAKLASQTQKAVQASRVADANFASAFEKVESITAKQLSVLEKQSGIKGLKNAVLDVNKAQGGLKEAWAELQKIESKYGVNSPQYVKALRGVSEGQAELNKALDGFGAKLKPRAVPSPAAGYEGILAKTESRIAKLEDEANRLEKEYKYAYLDSAKKNIQERLVETRDELNYRKWLLEEYVKLRDKGIPFSEMKREIGKFLVEWEKEPPTQSELRKLFDDFSRRAKPITPLPEYGKPTAKPKVQVAVIEKPVKVAEQLTLKLKPEYKEPTAKPEVKPKVPKVEVKVSSKTKTGKGYDISYEPDYKEKLEAAQKGQRDVYVEEVIGRPLPGLSIVIAGRTVTSPETEQVIKTTTVEIIKKAIDEATKAQAVNKTVAQIKNAVQSLVQSQTRTITDIEVKTQVQQQAKAITELATQVATKTAQKVVTAEETRVGIKRRIFIPIIVKLPNGKKHTLTEEELAGTVAWKQGFIFKHIFPPYGQNDAFNTRKPILGVPIYSGAGAAYRSIIRKGGKLPPVITRAMGIEKVVITTPPIGKPRLQFIPVRQPIRRRKDGHKRRRVKPRESAPSLASMRM